MIGRIQSTGGGLGWGWELPNYVTDSVIRAETPPAGPLHLASLLHEPTCMLLITDYYCYDCLYLEITVWSGLFQLFFNHWCVFLLAIRSSHSDQSVQEAAVPA